jgi:transcription antitermination factor NusG
MNLDSFGFCWYAIQVKLRSESAVALMLRTKGYEEFLPLYRAAPSHSRLKAATKTPLFPGYVFCRFDPMIKAPIVTTPGIVRIISCGGRPVPVSDQEIDNLRAIVASDIPVFAHPFCRIGQRVLLVRGPLAGVHGVLLSYKSGWRVVVSVDLLQRSSAVEVDINWIDPIHVLSTAPLQPSVDKQVRFPTSKAG